MTRFGYFVPEFPGQTHAFFWREVEALRSLNVMPEIISTRLPARGIMSHTWTKRALNETSYLVPLRPMAITSAILELWRAGGKGRKRVAQGLQVATRLERDNSNILTSQFRNYALVLAAARLVAIARKRGWVHLHVHSCAHAAQVALYANLLAGLPYSVTLHGSLSDYGTNQDEKWRHAAFGIVITQKLLHEVELALGRNRPPTIDVAPMGVDTAELTRVTPYAPWREKEPLRIFSCGRLNKSKGHSDLIGAVRQLAAQGIDVHLSIAGEDEQGGSGYRLKLEREVHSFGMIDRVEFLGAVPMERVQKELEQAHLFVLASHAEPLGVAIMEAMAMEVPVIATRAGGVPELVSDGENGLLVTPRDPDELARTISLLIRDGKLAMQLSKAGRETIEESFSSKRSARILAEFISKAQTHA